MNERREAQALARHLDSLIGGQDGTVWSAAPSPVSAEIAALGEVGGSLASIQFAPRPAHQAAFDRLLQKHRPTLSSGGSTMPFSAGGIPLHLILLTITLFVGSLVFRAALAPAPVRENRPSLRTAVQTTPVQAPMRSLTVTVRSLQQTLTATPTSTATMIPTATLTPAASGTPTSRITPTSMLTPTATLTPTASVTPTSATTPTATVTPTTPMTPSAPLAPPATLTPTPSLTPPLTPPLTAEAKAERTGLAFHPAHLNAGGECKASYSASGSLKNHGPALATGVDIGYTVIGGAQWVERVEVSPSSWAELGTSKPGRFTVHVHTNDNWPLAGKGTQIVVRLDVQGGTQATFTIKNQCQAEKPDESDKPDKTDKPDKDKKPKKSKGSYLPSDKSFWASLLAQSEV